MNRRLVLSFAAVAMILTAGCARPAPMQASPDLDAVDNEISLNPLAGKTLVARARFDFGEAGWYRDDRIYQREGEYILVGQFDHAYSYRNFSVLNPVVSVDVRPIQNDNTAYGFGLNIRQQEDPAKRYSFWINALGQYVIYRFDGAGAFQELTPWTGHSSIRKGLGSVNTLRVHVHQDQFTLYVNDAMMTAVSDSTYADGSVGFFVNNRQIVAFDNFELYQ